MVIPTSSDQRLASLPAKARRLFVEALDLTAQRSVTEDRDRAALERSRYHDATRDGGGGSQA